MTSASSDGSVVPQTVFGTSAPQGSIAVQDGVLVLTGDIDSDLCQTWALQRPATADVQAIDARGVDFLGSAGLALLAGVAQQHPAPLPLWATSRIVLRPLTVTGLDRLFDLRDRH